MDEFTPEEVERGLMDLVREGLLTKATLPDGEVVWINTDCVDKLPVGSKVWSDA